MPSLSSSSSSASFIPSISESRYSWNRNEKLKLYKTKNFCSLFLIPFDPFKTNNNPNNNKMNRFILLKDFWKKKHKSSKEMLLNMQPSSHTSLNHVIHVWASPIVALWSYLLLTVLFSAFLNCFRKADQFNSSSTASFLCPVYHLSTPCLWEKTAWHFL